MERVQELIKILSSHSVQARAFTARKTNTCKICGGSAIEFHSNITKLEYNISGICERCQEYYYLDESNN